MLLSVLSAAAAQCAHSWCSVCPELLLLSVLTAAAQCADIILLTTSFDVYVRSHVSYFLIVSHRHVSSLLDGVCPRAGYVCVCMCARPFVPISVRFGKRARERGREREREMCCHTNVLFETHEGTLGDKQNTDH